MRHSEFWSLVSSVFGAEYGPTLAKDLALDAYESLTARDALDNGAEPRDVWHALCDQMEIPHQQRDGGAPERLVPPPR